jgi:hypothetical protein
MEQTESSTRLEQLQISINDKEYLYAAIQWIADKMSDRLTATSQGEARNERQRKRRR